MAYTMEKEFEKLEEGREKISNITLIKEETNFNKVVIRAGNIKLTFFRKERVGNRLGKPIASKDDASNLSEGALDVSPADKRDAYALADQIFKSQEKQLIRNADRGKILEEVQETIDQRGGDPED